MSTTTIAPYRALHPYCGSKQRPAIRNWVLSHFPTPNSYKTYIEPFAGAASMLLAIPRAKREVLVERCVDQYTLLKVLRDRPLDFLEATTDLASTEEEEASLYRHAMSHLRASKVMDDIERALYQLVRNCLSWHSKGVSYKWRYNEAGKNIRPDWQLYRDRAIMACERLEGVAIYQGDGLTWTYDYNRRDTFFYFDPPYLHETRLVQKLYNHELGEAEHVRLLERANRLKGMVAISGYPSALYESYLPAPKWRRVSKVIRAVRRKKTECLWLNY